MIENDNYSVTKSDYDRYVEINGIKHSASKQALDVKEGNALYFVINKNNEFYTDFCIFKENNWLTLNENYLINKEILDLVLSEIKNYVNNIRLYIPVKNTKVIDFLVNNYSDFKVTDVKQGDWLYKQFEKESL